MKGVRWVAFAVGLLVVSCTTFGSEPSEPSPDPSPVDGSASEAGPDAAFGPCQGEAACPRFVFVTSDLYSGEDIGASIGADGKCTVRASLATALPILKNRKWQAWMSDDIVNTSASARLTHGTMPYRLANGTLVANDWIQLTSGALAHAIDVDEMGKTVGQDFVWTGTQAFGQATALTCTNWSINGANNRGTVGIATRADSSWTNAGATPCGEGHRMYCFEK